MCQPLIIIDAKGLLIFLRTSHSSFNSEKIYTGGKSEVCPKYTSKRLNEYNEKFNIRHHFKRI
jgi:hypothetical protein